MALLTTINLFPVDETNTTRSKLDGSYSKITLFSADEPNELEANWMVLITKIFC